MLRPLIAAIALASFSAINAQTDGIPDVSAVGSLPVPHALPQVQLT